MLVEWWRKVMIGSRQGHDTLRLRLNWDISYRWRTRDECLTLDRYKVGDLQKTPAPTRIDYII